MIAVELLSVLKLIWKMENDFCCSLHTNTQLWIIHNLLLSRGHKFKFLSKMTKSCTKASASTAVKNKSPSSTKSVSSNVFLIAYVLLIVCNSYYLPIVSYISEVYKKEV